MPNCWGSGACTDPKQNSNNHLTYKNPIILPSTNKVIFLWKPWTIGEWSFALEAQTKFMVRSSQRRKLHYPMVRRLTDRYPKLKIEPQESSRRPRGQGPSANLSSPIPVPRGGSDHGRLPQEGGGVGLGEERDPLASWLSCRLLHLTYHSTSPRLW